MARLATTVSGTRLPPHLYDDHHPRWVAGQDHCGEPRERVGGHRTGIRSGQGRRGDVAGIQYTVNITALMIRCNSIGAYSNGNADAPCATIVRGGGGATTAIMHWSSRSDTCIAPCSRDVQHPGRVRSESVQRPSPPTPPRVRDDSSPLGAKSRLQKMNGNIAFLPRGYSFPNSFL